MIAYLARTFPVVLRSLARRDGALVSRVERRVRPSEIDLNLHMNQAAYLRVCELGRTDWVIRAGALARWREAGIKPVVAEQRVVYRRELKPLQRYALETRAVRVEGRLLWLETHLLVGAKVHAKVDAALIFIGEGGVLSPEQARQAAAPFVTEPLAVEGWTVR
jgi:acyl-CoA thioesterase FadM